LGGTRGQSPFRDDLVVREEQPTVLGFMPLYGRIEVTCRATIGPRSMFSAWMIGLEDEPDRCGEICLVEVFGDAIGEDAGTPVVQHGCGIKETRGPALTQEFDTMPLRHDVADDHRYAASWTPDGVDFLVDDVVVRRSARKGEVVFALGGHRVSQWVASKLPSRLIEQGKPLVPSTSVCSAWQVHEPSVLEGLSNAARRVRAFLSRIIDVVSPRPDATAAVATRSLQPSSRENAASGMSSLGRLPGLVLICAAVRVVSYSRRRRTATVQDAHCRSVVGGLAGLAHPALRLARSSRGGIVEED
jgi:Glycosyl hydrolases family 16